MLYFLYGEDKDKARSKANGLVETLLKKKPDASFFKLTNENFSQEHFEEYIGGQGLFENRYVVLADDLFEYKEIKDFIVKRFVDLKESQNIFIFREGELDKATLTKIEKNAEKIQEFNLLRPAAKTEEFKIFTLTDALGRRDKKNLWVLYVQAKNAHVEDEQIHGILFWQIKNMLTVLESKNAADAGLNPFVYSKAQGFLKNFKREELQKMSAELVTIYHEARRGAFELSSGVEEWILSI